MPFGGSGILHPGSPPSRTRSLSARLMIRRARLGVGCGKRADGNGGTKAPTVGRAGSIWVAQCQRDEPHSTLSNGRLALPGAHAICAAFIKIVWSHECLDPSTFHIVSNGIAHTDKSSANAHFLQLFDETKQFIFCTNVDEVDRGAIQEHALYIWPRGQ